MPFRIPRGYGIGAKKAAPVRGGRRKLAVSGSMSTTDFFRVLSEKLPDNELQHMQEKRAGNTQKVWIWCRHHLSW